jgi:Paraquat-inducible protein A
LVGTVRGWGRSMKLVTVISSVLFSISSLILCCHIIIYSLSNQKCKNDYAELNHIKYGLLSIEEWNRQVTTIIGNKINKFDLSKTNRQDLRTHIEAVLSLLIDEVDQKIKEANSSSSTGRIKQAFIDVFISLEDIKKGIPEYADAVIDEMTKSGTRDQLKIMLINKLRQYSNQTFDRQNKLQVSHILLQTGSKDIESARIHLITVISSNRDMIFKETIVLIMLSVILFLMSGFSKKPLDPFQYILLVVSLILLLTAGVTTPMIDMEAKISHLGFVLMGHSIHFENQVLYFQSKSILDVFWILMSNQDIPMKFVGVLLITFSVFFPLLKIISTVAYYYNYHLARDNPVIKFFVLKSGKWSMADVMVVAMFMAYIGFNAIITNQFDQLSTAGQQLDLVTTNGTALQPGYYLFLAYCLLGLFLSEFITRKLPAADPKNI